MLFDGLRTGMTLLPLGEIRVTQNLLVGPTLPDNVNVPVQRPFLVEILVSVTEIAPPGLV